MNIGPMFLAWASISSDLRATEQFTKYEIEQFRLIFLWGAHTMFTALARDPDGVRKEMEDLKEHVKTYPMCRKGKERPELRVIIGGGDDQAGRQSEIQAEIRTRK